MSAAKFQQKVALPEVVVVPILVFIGLEIAAQSFRLVPERHAPAVAACFLPVAASLLLIVGGQWLSGAGVEPEALRGEARAAHQAVRLLANGFVFSSLLFGAAGALGGYQRTPAGQATVAAFVDAYNKMVGSFETQVFTQAKRFEGLGSGSQKEIASPPMIEVAPRPLTKLSPPAANDEVTAAE